MKRILLAALFLAAVLAASAQSPYVPPRGEWARKAPAEAGFDPAKLKEAIAYAESQESAVPRDFSDQVRTFGRVLGPMPKERGGTNGLVLRGGYIVAEFGDTTRDEPTYSAAKSYLSTLAGVAFDKGLVPDLDEPVGKRVKDGGYDSERNAQVTWRHHLVQNSEWEGALWGKSSDFVGVEEYGSGQRRSRELQQPGTFYEYNDVRINRLALSLMRLFGQPLPEVLKESVMDPIGASDTWTYHGYENSWVEVDGKRMQSVTGGTRWGGGLWIDAQDHARFGLLALRKGMWGDQRIVSEKWLQMAAIPSATKDDYGFLWWLNPGRRAWPALSERAFAAVGYGSNTVWVDPEHDLVVVWRWHKSNGAEFLKRVVEAIR